MTGTMPAGTLSRFGRVCYRRRRWVLLVWLLGATALTFLAIRFAAAPDYTVGGGKTSDSGQAQALIAKHFPTSTGLHEAHGPRPARHLRRPRQWRRARYLTDRCH
jgi:uncharacterized membrane protein YdfJ with MMPL/SSD domain